MGKWIVVYFFRIPLFFVVVFKKKIFFQGNVFQSSRPESKIQCSNVPLISCTFKAKSYNPSNLSFLPAKVELTIIIPTTWEYNGE